MISLWFLLTLFFAAVRTLSCSRQSDDGRPRTPEMPDCDQLRAFWEIMSRTFKVGEVTNEIPTLHRESNSLHAHHKLGSPRQNKYLMKDIILNRLNIEKALSQDPWEMDSMLQNSPVPLQPKPPSEDDLNGIFGPFHQQLPEQQQSFPQIESPSHHEALGFGSSAAVPLGAKKNDESEFYIPQWGSPEDVDTFGGFLDIDLGSPHFAMPRIGKDMASGLPDLMQGFTNQESFQVTCDVLINTGCTINEQCNCRGWKKLTCILGKCQDVQFNNDKGKKYETWHDGPLPKSQLGLVSTVRKRSNRSIFM